MPISAVRWPTRSASGSARARRTAQRFARVARERIRCRARSGRRGEPRSAEHRRSRSRDDGAAAAASELQGIRRAAGLAGVQLALAPATAPILRCCCKACRPITLQVSIHPSASIGTSVFLDHATGIIVGAFAVIGDEVTILQNVTIGRKQSLPDRAPRIGRGVYSAPDRRSSAMSASAISPRSAPARSSSMMCRPDAPRSAFPRG